MMIVFTSWGVRFWAWSTMRSWATRSWSPIRTSRRCTRSGFSSPCPGSGGFEPGGVPGLLPSPGPGRGCSCPRLDPRKAEGPPALLAGSLPRLRAGSGERLSRLPAARPQEDCALGSCRHTLLAGQGGLRRAVRPEICTHRSGGWNKQRLRQGLSVPPQRCAGTAPEKETPMNSPHFSTITSKSPARRSMVTLTSLVWRRSVRSKRASPMRRCLMRTSCSEGGSAGEVSWSRFC